jgi:signal transduction histidine kinase
MRSLARLPRVDVMDATRVPFLVESSRAAGLPVAITIEGQARALPPPLDAAAFRIVQESLTNVIRHAGAAHAHATVSVRHDHDDVEIEITDDGHGAATAATTATVSGGHGLAGMRERVALLGGELDAHARLSGGYRVRARLPL